MPNMDGYQAAKLIRNLSDGRRTIPIIAMTANAFDKTARKPSPSAWTPIWQSLLM